MPDGKEKSIVEWIGMIISILAMLALSFRGRKSESVEETEEPRQSRNVKRNSHEQEELFDDEEPEGTRTHVKMSAPPSKRVSSVSSKGQLDSIKRSVHVHSHVKKQAERLRYANSRLKSALEGIQQRRPLDQKSSKNAIERRNLDNKFVSESLRVDADADARGAAWLKKEEHLTQANARLRNGLIWSQILQPPLALRKGSDLL